jgi:hypothetical protein
MKWSVSRAINSDAAETLRAEAVNLVHAASEARHPVSTTYFLRELARKCLELANEIEYACAREHRRRAGVMAFAGKKVGLAGLSFYSEGRGGPAEKGQPLPAPKPIIISPSTPGHWKTCASARST